MEWIKRLHSSYDMWRTHKKYDRRFLDMNKILSCCLFAQDPVQCRIMLPLYEQFFLTACNKLDAPFALGCLKALITHGADFSSIPLLSEVVLETLRQKKVKPTASNVEDIGRMQAWIGETKSLRQKTSYSLISIDNLSVVLDSLRVMLWHNDNLEIFQKKIQDLAFLKKIKDTNLEAIRLYHKLLPAYFALPQADKYEPLTYLFENLKSIPPLLKALYGNAEETAEMEKEFQALEAHWKLIENKDIQEKNISIFKKSLENRIGKEQAARYSVMIDPEISRESSEELKTSTAGLKAKCVALKISWDPSWNATTAQKAIDKCLKILTPKHRKTKASKTLEKKKGKKK